MVIQVTTIVLAVAVVSLVAALVWMMHTTNTRVDETLAASDVLSKTRDELGQERLAASEARFEIAQTKTALASETARADALEDFISHEARDTDAKTPLAPDDVAGRVFRLSQRWGAVSTGAAGGSVPAVSGGAVHDAPAPAAPGSGVVHKPGT